MADAAQSGSPRILLSDAARQRYGERIAQALGGDAFVPVGPGDAAVDADIAFVSRDVTGLSTKHEILPDTQRFYDAMLGSPRLRWAHTHAAGADRAVFVALRQQGVAVTTSSGANAGVVAQTALAGVLALARRFPRLMAAQRQRKWAPLIGSGVPRDLAGQTATVVGWGPIGQQIGNVLRMLGLNLVVVRQNAQARVEGAHTVAFDDLASVLPRTDWLVLACPLTDSTRGIVDAAALALLPPDAHLVNVARGEVVDEPALIAALRAGKLAGAYLDVFAHEPLPEDSPLWTMESVIATPHSAGFSDGNAERVFAIFLDNLRRWRAGEGLVNLVR
ncbi:D-2-hydroxyacid dehydrogenase [Cupriavidus respiraculi]|uniref:D-2-hydroxyacid dehydrogenase n=1 Tax=Cupriavidus respiraculi TaxID=195930 RepID=UPI001C975702|nr:D-2-hydroxyacid dehydrogenase [Cupriavidus respiraculi]MBY4947269.1 D-2-hydroxyacid dehydrogenase [Cupriavidus respiraculi]